MSIKPHKSLLQEFHNQWINHNAVAVNQKATSASLGGGGWGRWPPWLPWIRPCDDDISLVFISVRSTLLHIIELKQKKIENIITNYLSLF